MVHPMTAAIAKLLVLLPSPLTACQNDPRVATCALCCRGAQSMTHYQTLRAGRSVRILLTSSAKYMLDGGWFVVYP
ncbi:hypothetical protein BDV38DRAFT_238553 [Aspergillus pseudotamarii]|uniref:Secreted protein n=1 Tax=Aspergillus pseudotamarii TaxID=132259 RepID=A0A5N6T429_ASPPS|nr:uncharacterized protein BDV38DRAFT_238553 [Aspergillus pseudotamarii]KAE8141052.1 hypothetical protein BDV38DRAFT_238553 [Aspergillus pseudotamarii]